MKRYIKADVTDILDEDYEIRSQLAKDSNTRPATLAKLAKDKDWGIRKRVAMNPLTPEAALYDLAADEDHHVKMGIVDNPNAPKDILFEMMEDSSWVCLSLAEHSQDPEILEILTNSTDNDVRATVAFNENLPVGLLEKLSKDPDPYIREAVIDNFSTPNYLLRWIQANDKVNYLRNKAKHVADAKGMSQ